MKSLSRFFAILLAFLLGLLMFGCGGTTTEVTTVPVEEESIVGEYMIDITDLGMPLIFYLKIDADDNFYLSPDRTYVTDKGHGTVGSSGNTYMLIYSDSTAETPKTSTFEIEESNLHFQTTLPYGSSNLPASKEDETDPSIIYYLVGKVLVYEDYFGEYAGSHTVSAMGSDVVYDYTLKFSVGREFSFVSNFTMGEEAYQYEETGYYDIEDGVVTLHLDTEVVEGSFDEDTLVIPVKASEMGSREERTLQLAVTAACASTFYGHLDKENPVNAILVLDKFGGYSFTSDDGSFVLTESGSFTFDNGALVFSPEGDDDSYTGTLANYVLNASFVVDDLDGVREDITFFCETIQGEFIGETTDELENEYQASLTLYSNATFSLLVKKGEETIIEQSGTFSVRRFMFVQLILTSEDETVYEMVISEVGLNVNFTLADESEIGFSLKKE
jgi:hypothetical protein